MSFNYLDRVGFCGDRPHPSRVACLDSLCVIGSGSVSEFRSARYLDGGNGSSLFRQWACRNVQRMDENQYVYWDRWTFFPQ
ncbi:hypothetical protein CEXT_464191 [Caerostris extrusa]|uniref:Uncharacterized protein n=1 Tax=Caerostris extrusa TaxID=172846 RepID=A0AAV4R6N1_CAEEX|nr:hypothetical protein CEXT_464191 [Caerostris extrusa]